MSRNPDQDLVIPGVRRRREREQAKDKLRGLASLPELDVTAMAGRAKAFSEARRADEMSGAALAEGGAGIAAALLSAARLIQRRRGAGGIILALPGVDKPTAELTEDELLAALEQYAAEATQGSRRSATLAFPVHPVVNVGTITGRLTSGEHAANGPRDAEEPV